MAEYILKTAGGGFIGGSNGSIAKYVDSTPPTPSLPAGTLRFKFSDSSYDPTSVSSWNKNPTWTQVSSSPNIWDASYDLATAEYSLYNAFNYKFTDSNNLVEVVDSNLLGVENLRTTFIGCTSLKSFNLKNTGDVKNWIETFRDCSGLTEIPIIDISSAVDISECFRDCKNISSGILRFYNNCISHNAKPGFAYGSSHYSQISITPLYNAGIDTTNGNVENANTSRDYNGRSISIPSYNRFIGLPYKMRSQIFSTGPGVHNVESSDFPGLQYLTVGETVSPGTPAYHKDENQLYDNSWYFNWSAIQYFAAHPEIFNGWHIPSKQEYDTLFSEFGGSTGLGTFMKPGTATGYEGKLSGYLNGTTWTDVNTRCLHWTSYYDSQSNTPNKFFTLTNNSNDAQYIDFDATGDNFYAQVMLVKDSN